MYYLLRTTSFAVFVALLLSTVLVDRVLSEDYKTIGLKAHNKKRALHKDVEPVKLDNDIQSVADKCATYYETLKIIDHSCPYKRTSKFGNLGENLYMANGVKADPKIDVNKAVDGWYHEIKDWDFKKGDGKKSIYDSLHFTQVVWKATNKIGIGYYTNPRTKSVVVVGLYGPAGNKRKEMKANVPPPKKQIKN